jgi:hypothetical protein
MLDVDTSPRSWIDYAGLALAGLLLAGLVVVGGYGTFTGFLQSTGYLKANEWVAIGAGAIGAGAALYLLMELGGGRMQGRAIFAVCFLSGLFSLFAVTKGVPAAATALYGRPAAVMFTVTGYDWGGRSCSRTVVAKNAGYEDFRMCEKYLKPVPHVGGTIEVRGPASGWGIIRENVRVY